MVPDDEITFSTCLLGRPNLSISNLGFICTTSVYQDRNLTSAKFCLISVKSRQYGSLKEESHTAVIISLFRVLLLNLSDVRAAFDATSGESSDDTATGSTEGGCCRCLRPFLAEVSVLFKYLRSHP